MEKEFKWHNAIITITKSGCKYIVNGLKKEFVSYNSALFTNIDNDDILIQNETKKYIYSKLKKL